MVQGLLVLAKSDTSYYVIYDTKYIFSGTYLEVQYNCMHQFFGLLQVFRFCSITSHDDVCDVNCCGIKIFFLLYRIVAALC